AVNAGNNDGEFQNAQIADNEPDGLYNYPLNGTVLVQAYWSISANAFVVQDTTTGPVAYLTPIWNGLNTASPTFSGSYDLLIPGELYGLNTDDTVTINTSNGAATGVNVDGTNFTFGGSIRDITVQLGGGRNEINIQGVTANQIVNVIG